jgi:hypothetical protein
VAALLNFRCGGQIMNWGNVSRRDAWGSSPNNLLHWRAIEAACVDAAGPRLYNFGGSGGHSGSRRSSRRLVPANTATCAGSIAPAGGVARTIAARARVGCGGE